MNSIYVGSSCVLKNPTIENCLLDELVKTKMECEKLALMLNNTPSNSPRTPHYFSHSKGKMKP